MGTARRELVDHLLNFGRRHLNECWSSSAAATVSAACSTSTAVLLEELTERGLTAQVQGEPHASFSGMPVALFPLLPGEHAPEEGVRHDPDPWVAMARVMAEMHQATVAVTHLRIRRETFDPLALPPIGECLRVVGSRAEELLRYIARFEQVRTAAARLGSPSVLCHGDFGRLRNLPMTELTFGYNVPPAAAPTTPQSTSRDNGRQSCQLAQRFWTHLRHRRRGS